MLAIQILDVDGVTLVRPLSDLTAEVGNQWRSRLAALPDRRRVVVDMDHTPFMDSAGLGVLIGAIRRIRADGGELVIASSEPSMRRLFHVTGLDKVVEVVDDIESAIEHGFGCRTG